jgi:hypothetical protein
LWGSSPQRSSRSLKPCQERAFRVARAYRDFVAFGEYTFRPQDNADRLHDVVKFNWEAVRCDDGDVASAGLVFLVLDEDGRIKTDYMFPG